MKDDISRSRPGSGGRRVGLCLGADGLGLRLGWCLFSWREKDRQKSGGHYAKDDGGEECYEYVEDEDLQEAVFEKFLQLMQEQETFVDEEDED